MTRTLWETVLVSSLVLTCGFTAAAVAAGDAQKGKSIYAARCAFCHGLAGKGDGPAGASLKPPPTNFSAADYWKTATVTSMTETIANGKPGTAMVPFKASLNDEQLDDLIAFLATFKPQP